MVWNERKDLDEFARQFMGTVLYSVVLVLLRLFLLFLLLLAVAIEHNGQNNESDT